MASTGVYISPSPLVYRINNWLSIQKFEICSASIAHWVTFQIVVLFAGDLVNNIKQVHNQTMPPIDVSTIPSIMPASTGVGTIGIGVWTTIPSDSAIISAAARDPLRTFSSIVPLAALEYTFNSYIVITISIISKLELVPSLRSPNIFFCAVAWASVNLFQRMTRPSNLL